MFQERTTFGEAEHIRSIKGNVDAVKWILLSLIPHSNGPFITKEN